MKVEAIICLIITLPCFLFIGAWQLGNIKKGKAKWW